ncbi:MarR family winged helix-turn-helix transcriptional regulator [Thalassospira profundimaris]|uniref:MarR family winged helix-turn-helix transcriptional regulator n=1 Tax=Thalassospira profundimaris TaxID=502049 RepID=UPI000DED4165|nr:MarR family winged helix-turn-helix transcriptional regulator [Thalassospira profundimaris]
MSKDKEPVTGGFDINLLLPFQITQLSTRLAAQARRIIARHGDLTLPQWRIIRIVAAGVASRSTAVRKSSGIDKGQFSKTINVLVDQGYILTRPCAGDQRQFEIVLTPKGHAAHERLAPELDARQRHLMAALTPDQRAVIFPAIRALAEAAETIDFLETPSTED